MAKPRHVVEFGKVGKPPQSDGRLDTPAFHRNHTAIWSLRSAFGGLYTCQITVARPRTEFSLLIRLLVPSGSIWMRFSVFCARRSLPPY